MDVLAKYVGEGLTTVFTLKAGQCVIVNGLTTLTQLIMEMPHRAEKKRQSEFVTPDMRRFAVRLGHPNRVAICFKTIEGR